MSKNKGVYYLEFNPISNKWIEALIKKAIQNGKLLDERKAIREAKKYLIDVTKF